MDFTNIASIPYLREMKTQLKNWPYNRIYGNKCTVTTNFIHDPHCLWFYRALHYKEANPIKTFVFSANSYFDFEHPNDPVYDNLIKKHLRNLCKTTNIILKY